MAPDACTFDYLRGRRFAPQGPEWERARAVWEKLRSDDDAVFDREFDRFCDRIERGKPSLLDAYAAEHESEFFAARSDINAEKEEEKQFEKQANYKAKDEVVKRDAYFNEVLAITGDYVNSLKTRPVAQAR